MPSVTHRNFVHPAQLKETRRTSFLNPSSIKNVQSQRQAEGKTVALRSVYVGIAVQEGSENTMEIGVVFHDGTYSAPEFGTAKIPREPHDDLGTRLADTVIQTLNQHRHENLLKCVAAGVNHRANRESPDLLSRLWQELDIVPLLFANELQSETSSQHIQDLDFSVDEEADSLARKAATRFTNTSQPNVQVAHQHKVEVDCGGRAVIVRREEYFNTVHPRTWQAMMHYANSLISDKVKIAFFSATPQGGGVALMRHALIRFLRSIDIKASWYVPNPVPSIFRITKDNHNILQGVADPSLRLTPEKQSMLDGWCLRNARRHWINKKGPLAPRGQGGADVIIVDDPQMPGLVKIAKDQDPERPVIYRSHIQVRGDLANTPGTPTAEVWDWVWNNIKDADLFISHPVPDFIPANVTPSKVGYLPATTDWLDGLNKDLDDWDFQFYIHNFQEEAFSHPSMPILDHPKRKYIAQIARFDPSKGIPDVLASYALLRRTHMKDWKREDTPQLCLSGHGAIDDPDANIILKQTKEQLDEEFPDIKDDVIFMRLESSDQLLNALISGAHVALQLSTREGFEVKVSEALHKGIPIIATLRGGIPLQVQDGKSGFLVEAGDHAMVAQHLYDLFTDNVLYKEMATYAKDHVSDEVSTVGNALAWLYMADTLHKRETIKPHSRWINDMAREKADLPYLEKETRLPRNL
ncbi:putative trehalose synthase-like protein [Byssothecium circinans]|uniref:Putative trehalose synthase-like protein n=1 Tax=Byssothecium circinans TaxID=147558 RepID=A0A6A5U8V1_9PLEO|nr:putative trehalose synthase-like protein [Byssothecium circinans]